jgi:hypothetical protein
MSLTRKTICLVEKEAMKSSRIKSGLDFEGTNPFAVNTDWLKGN